MFKYLFLLCWNGWMKGAHTLQFRSFSSVVQKHKLFGRDFYIKRDDLLGDNAASLNGNKGRKLSQLLVNPPSKKYYGSYGGFQSNSMTALSKLALAHKKQLLYFTDTTYEIEKFTGNIRDSLDRGMKLQSTVKSSSFPDMLSEYISDIDPNDVFWVPQGGCFSDAMAGVHQLGAELNDFIQKTSISSNGYKQWKVIVSCGTGTTALFLAQYFHEYNSNVEVLAVPCAGSRFHLIAQMQVLDSVSKNMRIYPTVVSSEPKRMFAKPCVTHWKLWNSLREQTNGVEFDLIYAPRCWELLIEHFGCEPSKHSTKKFEPDSQVLSGAFLECGVINYHCGGVEGNQSMLPRYDKIRKKLGEDSSSTSTSASTGN